MSNLVLIGPRGVGKSSVGRDLSKMLESKYVDADEFFTLHTKQTVEELIKNNPWEEFRKVESGILRAASIIYKTDKLILSAGGGAVAHPEQNNLCVSENIHSLKNIGKLVYLLPYEDLNRSAEILSLRIIADKQSKLNRPSINGYSDSLQDILKMLKDRDELYKSASDMIIYTGSLNSNQVARQIISHSKWSYFL